MNKHLSIVALVFLLLLVTTGCGLAQQQTPLDKDPVPFAKATNAPWLVIKPGDHGMPNKIDIKTDANGADLVEYTVQRDGPEFIAHPVPLSGFSKIGFRVWSKGRTMLVIILEDGDKAKFHVAVPVNGDRWTDVSVVPSEFQINDDSPVKKQTLDPQIVSSPFILVDAGFMIGQKEPNTIKLSEFRVELGKAEPATRQDG